MVFALPLGCSPTARPRHRLRGGGWTDSVDETAAAATRPTEMLNIYIYKSSNVCENLSVLYSSVMISFSPFLSYFAIIFFNIHKVSHYRRYTL